MPTFDSADLSFERAVSPMELFYDLVFVFAVSQLSHHLLLDPTVRGTAETLALLVAVFTVWVLTSFEATYFDTGRGQTQVAILLAMVLGLFMNAAIPRSFSTGGWAFAVPLVVTQAGRGVLTAATAPTPQLRIHYRHLLAWVAISTPLWLAGAAVEPDTRLWWWLAAAGVDLAGVWLAHPVPGRGTISDNVAIDGAHMTERLRLFLIIALGEVVLTTGAAISEVSLGPMTLLVGTASFAVVACLWGIYFGGRAGMKAIDATTERDPVWLARMGANGQYVVLAGLIGVAVACERVIAEPQDDGSPTLSLLLCGGLLLYVGTQTWYLAITTNSRLTERWFGCVGIAGIGAIAVLLPAFATLLLARAVLAPLAVLTIRRRITATMR